MEPQPPFNIEGTKRRVIRRKVLSPLPPPELVFTQSKGPDDFCSRRERPRKRRAGTLNSQEQDTPGEQQELEKSSSPTDIVSAVKVPPTIPNSTLLEHVALSRFFHHYVSTDRTFCRLDLDFTSFVVNRAAMRSSLAEVIIALGILTLPRKTEASCNAARLRYGRALRLTNQSIKDKVEATSDEVLMAVILLSLFETTPDERHTTASWTAHLNGARLLLRIRGRGLLQRGPAYRMFSILRQQILVNCLVTMQPVPQDLVDLSVQLMERQDEDERAASEITLMFARLCNLLASSRNATYLDREAILKEARLLDDDLVGWSLNRPASYEFFTEPAKPALDTYAGYCEVYSSLFAAEVWNFYRMTRLGVNGIIIEQQSRSEMEMLGGEEAEPSQSMQEAAVSSDLTVRLAILESLRHDVCAGTPFMLGVHRSDTPPQTREIPLCKSTPVMHQLLFLLKTVGISNEMSSWVNDRIAQLHGREEAENGGVYHAKAIRDGHYAAVRSC